MVVIFQFFYYYYFITDIFLVLNTVTPLTSQVLISGVLISCITFGFPHLHYEKFLTENERYIAILNLYIICF